jgi:hypothetical protein
MDGSRLAVLEASLIRLGCDEMRRRGLDPFQYCLLHDLRDVGPHYYRPDLVQSTWTFSESFLQGDSLPTFRYSGIWELFRASVISYSNFVPSCSF